MDLLIEFVNHNQWVWKCPLSLVSPIFRRWRGSFALQHTLRRRLYAILAKSISQSTASPVIRTPNGVIAQYAGCDSTSPVRRLTRCDGATVNSADPTSQAQRLRF